MVENVNTNTGSNSTLNDTLGGKLTDREKWLMRRALVANHSCLPLDRARLLLRNQHSMHAADGVTVEMVLAKDAP